MVTYLEEKELALTFWLSESLVCVSFEKLDRKIKLLEEVLLAARDRAATTHERAMMSANTVKHFQISWVKMPNITS